MSIYFSQLYLVGVEAFTFSVAFIALSVFSVFYFEE
jgi:hypothetical protein